MLHGYWGEGIHSAKEGSFLLSIMFETQGPLPLLRYQNILTGFNNLKFNFQDFQTTRHLDLIKYVVQLIM